MQKYLRKGMLCKGLLHKLMNGRTRRKYKVFRPYV